MKKEHDIFNRVMTKDNIAVVTFLENRVTGTRLIVVNIHVYWDPAYNDVKVVQVAILMEEIERLADKYSKWPPCTNKTLYKYTNGDGVEEIDSSEIQEEPGPSVEYPDKTSIPFVLCGDFNSTPDSGVTELITHGALSHQHPDLANRNYGDFTRTGMNHIFNLKSSYAGYPGLTFTNYTPGFVGILDYIFYSANSLQVTSLLGKVDEKYLQQVPGFPNYHFPSDHLLLLSEFAVKGRKEKKVVEADFGGQRDRDRDRDLRAKSTSFQ
jgi:CCR4-NOT transcription complex subunit 6